MNRSKSECLLLTFEINLNEYSEQFLGIPVVQNLKILGHYHGKSELVCNFQNFYNIEDEQEKDRKLYRSRNITEHFIQQIFKIPNNNIWIPKRKALLQAGVISADFSQNK